MTDISFAVYQSLAVAFEVAVVAEVEPLPAVERGRRKQTTLTPTVIAALHL